MIWSRSTQRTVRRSNHKTPSNRIEKRRPRSIDLEVLDKLAAALGIDPALLVVRVPDEAPKKKGRRGAA
jgi:hypothetical protein